MKKFLKLKKEEMIMTKKITAGVLAIMMILGTGVLQTVNILPETAITASAAEDKLKFGDYDYKILDDGTVAIVKYNGNDSELTIPSQIDGKQVTALNGYSFYNRTSLKSVTIPKGVTFIRGNAFSGCTGLKSISIPDTVTKIGDSAFAGTALTSLTIPDSVTTLGINICNYCTNLKTVKIGNGVTSTNALSFAHCTALTDVTIGSGVESISDDSFRDCKSLAKIYIPENVTYIGVNAFKNTALKSVTIPSSVTGIGAKAFGYYTEGTSDVKVDGFKIYCFEGTEGENYAVKNGFDYEYITSVYLPGDVNGDGAIDIADVSQLMNHINGVKSLDEDSLLRADTDGSKTIDVSDAAKIVNHINGVKSLY